MDGLVATRFVVSVGRLPDREPGSMSRPEKLPRLDSNQEPTD